MTRFYTMYMYFNFCYYFYSFKSFLVPLLNSFAFFPIICTITYYALFLYLYNTLPISNLFIIQFLNILLLFTRCTIFYFVYLHNLFPFFDYVQNDLMFFVYLHNKLFISRLFALFSYSFFT